MMIHDFDLCRLYLGNDEISEIHAFASSFEPFYKKIKDHELAAVTMKSKKGVILLLLIQDIVHLVMIKELNCLVKKEC